MILDSINIEMNKIHTHYRCIHCSREYPETILNVEGHIHHNADVVCLDKRSCRRVKKKNKKKGE